MTSLINWGQAVIGIVIFTILTLVVGLLIWIFDKNQIGYCADSIITSFLLMSATFIAGHGARGSEAATGTLAGLGAVIPQTIISIFAGQFGVVSFFLQIVMFVILGAIGGAIAGRARE